MKFIDFFSGIGGFRFALDSSGMQCVWSCENNPFARRVYAERFGKEPEGGDIMRVRPGDIPDADIWCGGPPCQDLSVAGKRKGLAGSRSGLFYRFIELVRTRRPRYVLLEQVPGLLSSHEGRDMETWLGELAKLGYLGAYRIIGAEYLGVPQHRHRIYTLASLGDERVAQVLLEPEGGGWDHPQGGQAGTGPPIAVARSIGGVSGGQDYGAGKGNLVAPTVTGETGHKGQGCEDKKLVIAPIAPIAPIVTKDAGRNHRGQACEDGSLIIAASITSSSSPRRNCQDNLIVRQAVSSKWSKGSSRPAGDEHHNLVVAGPVAASLASGAHPNSNAPGRRREDDVNVVAYHRNASCSVTAQDDRTAALRAAAEHSNQFVHVAPAVDGTYSRTGNERNEAERMIHVAGSVVRRMTPTECERLQGFEDGHTCTCGIRPDCPDRRVPPWINPKSVTLGGCGHSACGCRCPNSPRYRALGNAVAVPAVRWIADRMASILKEKRRGR